MQMRSETPPWMLKTAAPAGHLAETIVLIDADMIVTRPLGELIERASAGKVVAFEAGYERFVPEWGELLDLGPIRRGPYVSSGLVFLGGEPGRETLRLMNELQPRVESFGGGQFRHDQRRLRVLRPRSGRPQRDPLRPGGSRRSARTRPSSGAGPPVRGAEAQRRWGPLRLPGRERAIRRPQPRADAVAAAGSPRAKPWLERRPSSVYSRLLTRYLLGANLAIEVPPGDVPPWLREGIAARFARAPVDTRHRAALLSARASAAADRAPRRRRQATPSARGSMNTSRRPGVAFYCVADERYFLGAVAMINSLRSYGHDRAAVPARLRAARAPAGAARAAGDPDPVAVRDDPAAPEHHRPDEPPRRGDGADRRRHDRHPAAGRADRARRRRSGRRLQGGVRPLRPRVGRAARPGADPPRALRQRRPAVPRRADADTGS